MKIEDRPQKTYTDEEWQNDFATMKTKVKQVVKSNQMNVIPDTRGKNERYYGKTQYQCYCSFINDILKTLRQGKKDYCYTFYQVEELLKFEHDRLVAKWLPESRCFLLTLKNNTNNLH